VVHSVEEVRPILETARFSARWTGRGRGVWPHRRRPRGL